MRVIYRALVSVYERNGKEVTDTPRLEFHTHGSCSDRVVLMHAGEALTILAGDLIEAVQRCSGGRL